MGIWGALAKTAVKTLPKAGLWGGAGAAGGYTSDRLWGDDDYSFGEGARDAGLGALFGLGGGLLQGAMRGAGWNTARIGAQGNGFSKAGGKFADAAEHWLAKYSSKGIAGSALLFNEDKDSEDPGKKNLNAEGITGPMLKGQATTGSMGKVNSDIYGGIGAPPAAFNRTLADYLADPTLGKLANDEIIRQNAPLMRANKARNAEMGRMVEANSDAGANLQNQLTQVQKVNADQTNKIAAAADASAQATIDQAQALSDRVGAMIVPGGPTPGLAADVATHGQDLANQRASSQELLSDLGQGAGDAIAQLAASDVLATKSNEQSIRESAAADIRNNSQQVRDNWLNRSSIMGSLADSAMQRDMQAHQSGMDYWGAKLQALNASRENERGWAAIGVDQQGMMQNAQQDQLKELLKFAQGGSGVQFKPTTKDGTETTVDVPAWATNPALKKMLEDMYGIDLDAGMGNYNPKAWNEG